MKPPELRDLAVADAAGAAFYYREEGGLALADSFVDALESAYDHIGHFPDSGSPHYGEVLRVAGLRHWPVGRFPYLILYIPREGHIDVWRILHAHRDIPDFLREPE